jgi:hypothetical protein
MITNKGKQIIAKYLIGTAPSFASYIALGCGPKPRTVSSQISGASSSGTTVTCDSVDGLWIGAAVYKVLAGTGAIPDNTLVTEILSSTQFKLSAAPTVALSGATVQIQTDDQKECLDFEMFRVPIISRGYINENGVDKIIFTGELPTEERYEISEIGIFSAGLNVSAGTYDSKTILAFSESENWKYGIGITLSEPNFISSSLTPNAYNIISTYEDIFETSADNPTFLNLTRSDRYEGGRYLNNMILMRGDTSLITGNPQSFEIADDAKYIQLSGQTFNFSKNSSADLLKVAFSLINVDGNDDYGPEKVNVIVNFSNDTGTQFAKLETQVLDSTQQFTDNRYFVASSRFDNLVYSPTFSWDAMSVVKIYVSANDIYDVSAITATTGNVTLTVDHGLPVNATITNAVKTLDSDTLDKITYTAVNTFSPGDTVNISGVTSSGTGSFNISNATVINSTASYFEISVPISANTYSYTSGGSAAITTKINFSHPTSSYTGTYTVTSVPSSTTLVYFVSGASLSPTTLSPVGTLERSRSKYFVALDAIRLDNIGTVNPLYGMTGYSLIQNEDAVTVVKNPNTNNYIEFRVNLGAL